MLNAITYNSLIHVLKDKLHISFNSTAFADKLCKVSNLKKQDIPDIEKKQQSGKKCNTTPINSLADDINNAFLGNSQQPSPNTLSKDELKQLAGELNQVLQHYQHVKPEKHTAYMRGYLEKDITLDGKKRKIEDYIKFDTKTDSQAKFSHLPCDKKSIAMLINSLLDGHAKQGTLYKAFSEISEKKGILGRYFSLDGISLLQNFHFTVRPKPLALPPEHTISHATIAHSPSIEPDPVKMQLQEVLERQKLRLEIKNEFTSRPVYQKLARLTRAAASLDGKELPPITSIITAKITLGSLEKLSLPQLRAQAKQLKEENINLSKQIEEYTQCLPTTQDKKLTQSASAMLQTQFTAPYIQVLDDSIKVLRQSATSRKNRFLSWLLPAQAKARQEKQEQTIGKLHELRQLITTLQSQGGSWGKVEKAGWAKQLLARNLEQAMPDPWQLGPLTINTGRSQWQAKLAEWGIPVNQG